MEQFKCWISNKLLRFDMLCPYSCSWTLYFRASAFAAFSFLFIIEQPVRRLASGVLGDLVADEVYLYFMVIVAPPPTHSFQKKLSGQDISLYL